MPKAYVMLVAIGTKDPNGEPIPVKRKVIKDAEVSVVGTSTKLPTFVAPTDFQKGTPFGRYMWIVKAVDSGMKVVRGMDPDAVTGNGYRLMTGDVEEFLVEEPGETLALVTI